MSQNEIPTVRKLLEVANIPDDLHSLLDSMDERDVARAIHDYYAEQESIRTCDYKFTSDESFLHRADSTVGIGGMEPDVTDIQTEQRFFSEYDFNTLERIGIDTEERWNGEISEVRYEDGVVSVGKSDYFSIEPFTRAMTAETAHSMYEGGGMPLRDRYMRSIEHLQRPVRPTAGMVGGVIVADTGDGMRVLLGRRSEMTDKNNGLLSTLPSGRVHHDDADGSMFENSVRREFQEELFDSGAKGEVFYDKHVIARRVFSGWSLRSGSLTVVYMLEVDSSVSYDVLRNASEHNEEISEIVEIPIDDGGTVTEVVSMDEMAGWSVAGVSETLRVIDELDEYPNLPYRIERI